MRAQVKVRRKRGWPFWNVADGLAELLPGKIELVGFLQIHPEILGGPK